MQGPDVDSDLFVEVLGILVNLDIPSCDWASLIAKHDLLNLLAGQTLHLPLLCSRSSPVCSYKSTAGVVCLLFRFLSLKNCTLLLLVLPACPVEKLCNSEANDSGTITFYLLLCQVFESDAA